MIGIVFAALYAEVILNWIYGKPMPTTKKVVGEIADTIPKTIPVPPPDERLKVRQGLLLWLRADVIDRPDSSRVPYWADGSGQNHHALQPLVPAQPLFLQRGIGGQPSVYFDGNNDYLHAGDVSPPDRLIPATVVIVWEKPDSGRDVWQRIFSTGSRGIDYLNNGANYVPHIPVQFGNKPAPAHIVIQRFKSPKDFSNFHIGKINVPNVQQYYCGMLAELLVYNRVLSDAEAQSIARYLQAKYSIPAERTVVR